MEDEYDLDALEDRLGVNVGELEDRIVEVLDADDDDVDGIGALIDGDEDEVASYIASKVPLGKNDPQVRQVARVMVGRVNAADRLLSGVAAAQVASMNMRPNSAVTLYARNEGILCEPLTSYSLRQRQTGVLSSQDFTFKETMTFHRLIGYAADAAAGFYIVGDSFGWEDDKAKPFDDDISVGIFTTDRPFKETPLASLHGRTPRDKTKLTATIRLDRPAAAANANDVAFRGLTLEYFDSECSKNWGRKWSNAVGALDFNGLSNALGQRVRRKIQVARRMPTRKPAPRRR